MKKEKLQEKWQGISEDLIVGMSEWRERHPRASMREIEEEIDKRLSEMRARMIADTAMNSASAEWEKGASEVCPKCGGKLLKKGKKKRKLETQGGKEIELEREYGICLDCGYGLFPLDEELELLSGKLTPCGHERLVRLSSYVPFEKAAELFEGFMGIQVSKGVGQRYTEEAGTVYEELEKEESEEIQKKRLRATVMPNRLQVSADGAMVPLLHGVWAEVKTLVIGEVQPAVLKAGESVVRTRNLSYFSRKVNSEEFERLSLVEMHRRGVENAKEVAAVMDGADWEQSFIDYHCPRAVRILDFAHAAEHISQIGEFLHGEHTQASQTWLKDHLHHLKHAGPKKMLREFRKLQRKHPQEQAVSSNLAYLQKREQQIQYPIFQAQGWPIGSGIVESGNKLVVEARLKGAGMHWAEQHVNPMLALRNIVCSNRWKEEWSKIEARIRKQRTIQEQVAPPACVSGTEALLLIFKEKLGTDPLPSDLPSIPQKAKPNPWRNFKHGKALCQRSGDLPKL